MARVQATDYDAKRGEITRHAARLFAAQGFGGASIADLAAACGFSKSLIYHYYAAKEDILYDVMRDHLDRLVAVKDAAAEPQYGHTEPAETRFRHLARALLALYVGAADSQKLLLYERAALTPTQRDDIVAKQRAIIDFTQALLAEMTGGAPDAATLRVKTMLFFGMLNWTHNWFRADGPVSRDAVADQAVAIVLADIGKAART